MRFQRLPTYATSAFADASAAALADNVRSIASVPGGFSKKGVKGKDYWYYKIADLVGGKNQVYVGPDSEQLRELIEQHRQPRPGQEHLRLLARRAIQSGGARMPVQHAKIVGRLADVGFFKAGGILVGTHAFLAYQNLLGVRWASGDRTQDVDFSHPGKNISIALPATIHIDTPSAIESLQMGFVPSSTLTNYIKSDEQELQIDFITALHRGGDEPIKIKALNVEMQPLKFMEFSMENTIQDILLADTGPIIVALPSPERYAVHKLLVYGERPPRSRLKAGKDLEQAANLIEYFLDNDPDLLQRAIDDLLSRGTDWRQRFQFSWAALRKQHADLQISDLKLPKDF